MGESKWIQGILPEPKTIFGRPITPELQSRIDDLRKTNLQITKEQAFRMITQGDRSSTDQERRTGRAP